MFRGKEDDETPSEVRGRREGEIQERGYSTPSLDFRVKKATFCPGLLSFA